MQKEARAKVLFENIQRCIKIEKLPSIGTVSGDLLYYVHELLHLKLTSEKLVFIYHSTFGGELQHVCNFINFLTHQLESASFDEPPDDMESSLELRTIQTNLEYDHILRTFGNQ